MHARAPLDKSRGVTYIYYVMAKRKDIAIIGGPTEDGQGARLLRVRDGNVTTGEIRPAREGQPVTGGELVRLRPLDAEQRICEVEVLHAAPSTTQIAEPSTRDEHRPSSPPRSDGERSGGKRSRPARVSNERYRKNWSAIFDTGRAKRDWSMN